MSSVDLSARIHDFERELGLRCSTRTEPTAFGTAFLNLDFPLRYDSNFVWVDRPLREADAQALAADADRVLGAHDLVHRKISVDDDLLGSRLAAAFLELGWSAERLLIMAQVREPDPRPEIPVQERGFAETRPFLEAVLRRQPYADSEEAVRQLTDIREVFEREAGARFFLADVDGQPASVCELYVLGDVAQVEDVNTIEEFRGRGLGSAVVLAAIAAARARECDVVFLVADDADWPKELYSRLGFDEVGRFWSFVRTPS
jgi:ribosomal protein S18 acetylase RimI-like enzyme